MMNSSCHEYDFSTEFSLLRCNKPFHFCSKDTFLLVHVPNFGGLSGSEDRGGVTTVSNSLILGGWVTNVL